MRSLLAALVVFLLAPFAFAVDVDFGVQQLDSDTLARIAVIGSPAATKTLAKEAKALQKAHEKLLTYPNAKGVAALKIVAAAAKQILLSRTSDSAILSDLSAIAAGVLDLARRREQFVNDEIARMIDPAHRAAVEAELKALAAALDRAEALLAENALKAQAGFISAYDKLGLVLLKARIFVEKEQGSPPPEGLVVVYGASSLALSNSSARTFDITSLRIFGIVSDAGGTVKTYTGEEAKSVIPGLFSVKFSNRIPAGTTAPVSFDLTPVLNGLVPQGTVNPRVQVLLWVTVKGQPFFVIPVDVTLP
jgi:hypothetical protein